MTVNSEKIIGVHLDLKYTMPNKTYLLNWVKRLPEFGITAILLEYEDKFPFQAYPFLTAKDAFSPDELHHFLHETRRAGLTIIPLVQSLSHLEFALEHDELAALREQPDIPTQICPQNPQALAFIHQLFNDVLSFHREDPYFHLGGDEAWNMGSCPACAQWIAEECKGDKVAAWSKHEIPLLKMLIEQGKQPILWDDAFWHNPDAAGDYNLPKETILHSWNYGITQFDPEKSLTRVDTYHRHGYRTLGAPCLDWGVLFPQRTHCLSNTAVWAQKMRQANMLGLINTGWSCFHVPFPNKTLFAAATGSLCRGETVDQDWECAFLEKEFAAPADGLPQTLETLGKLWEVGIDGLERPLTPIPYGCMDMILHYPGGQKQRQKCGAYPNNWEQIDFSAMYQQKIKLFRAASNRTEILTTATAFVEEYEKAGNRLRRLAKEAGKHQDEARLLLIQIELKKVLAQLICFHLDDSQKDVKKMRNELLPYGDLLSTALRPFLEKSGVARIRRIWWEAPLDSL